MLGCDLTKLDDWTLSLITNPEVIKLNQHSHSARQLSRDGDFVVWTSHSSDSKVLYVALFNLGEKSATQTVPLAKLNVMTGATARDLWSGHPIAISAGQLSLEVPAHGSRLISFR
jgi:hypothetical protein